MTSKISAIIAQHIATQTRIIIPEVGTLIRRKESGEIVFMEMLKKSDGTLASLIVNTLDVSPSKANEILNTYVATIKQQLTANKKFILDGVGVLLSRRDGGVDFSFNPFAQSLPEFEKGVDILEEDVVERPVSVAPTMVAPAEPAKPAEQKVAPVATPRPTQQPAPRPVQHPTPQPKVVGKIEEEEEPIQRKSKIQAHFTRKKIDGITIIAFIAVAMALISLIWGMIPSNDRVELDVEPIPFEVTE
jgi:hypothetical protein